MYYGKWCRLYRGNTFDTDNDKKNPRWEGSFEIRIKEKDIVYHEAYQVVLQNDGYFISLGIINSDAEQFELTSSLREMMGKRKIVKQKKLLDLKSRFWNKNL